MCGITGLYSRGFGSCLTASGCSVKDNAAQGVVASRGGRAEVSCQFFCQLSATKSCLTAYTITSPPNDAELEYLVLGFGFWD